MTPFFNNNSSIGSPVVWRGILAPVWAVGLICGLLSVNCANPQAQGQTPVADVVPGPPEASKQSALVEGLLDLLGETEDQAASAWRRDSAPPDVTPADHGFGANELPESSNPLVSVRQSMRIAAGHLSKGVANTETRQLQSGIVQQLDELIDSLEQAASNMPEQDAQDNQEPTKAQQQSQSAGQSSTQPEAEEAAGNSSQEPDPSERSSSTSQDTVGENGATAGIKVDLADPQALQQDVWGQLPEQLRKQMQSRMVERFLPSYRTQIEAYFQALLENPSP
jgi:hypothetical protein